MEDFNEYVSEVARERGLVSRNLIHTAARVLQNGVCLVQFLFSANIQGVLRTLGLRGTRKE